MGEILDLKTIHDYNRFLGLETLNPLVSFVDFSKVEVLPHRCKCFGFYAIFLKEKIHGPITYGRSKYDYQEGRKAMPCCFIPTSSGVRRWHGR